MTHRSICFQPTDLPFKIVLAILFLGGMGYFSALALTWMTA